jgi:hypothetical protein
MNREDVYRCWVPKNERWSAWVKPVLFANIADGVEPGPMLQAPQWLRNAVVEPLSQMAEGAGSAQSHPYRGDPRTRDTALIIDLPGELGARIGVGFVEYGFRPIPLYNAVPFAGAIIDLLPIMDVLVDGAKRVATVPAGAPPAFLLDADRMNGKRPIKPGIFDNRSMCWESDFPSANTLEQAGIRRVVLIQSTGGRPAFDLEGVLFAWQRRGIELWRKSADDASAAAPFVLSRRSWPVRLAYIVRRELLRERRDHTYGLIVAGPVSG